MDADGIEAMFEEDEDWLRDSPPRLSETVSNNKRKVLTIDDLLNDYHKEKHKSLDREFKRKRRLALSDSNSSEDEEFEEKTHTELQVEELIESCERQVHAVGAPVEVPKWGERIFGPQRRWRDTVEPKLEGDVVQLLSAARGRIVQSFRAPEDAEASAETIMSELLVSGWLVPLGVSTRKLDEATLCWIFHKMVFSLDKSEEKSAWEFWCHLLQTNSKNSGHHWMPSFEFILTIFQAYGYLGFVVSSNHKPEEILEADGPPHNLGSLLRFLRVSFTTKCLLQDLSAADAGNLLVLVATLSLDRQLLCYGALIQECVESIANHFTEDDWATTFAEQIANSMTQMDRHVVNCLRLTRSLHSSRGPMKSLQRSVALRFFSKISGNKAISGKIWEVLSVFSKVHLKNEVVDFVSLYYQMTLADIWLWSNPDLMSNQQALESWFIFLKSCSYQISSTDWRPYAAKVRNWASYLLTVYQDYRKGDDFEESSVL